jgi:hypothetical protein
MVKRNMEIATARFMAILPQIRVATQNLVDLPFNNGDGRLRRTGIWLRIFYVTIRETTRREKTLLGFRKILMGL